MKELKLHWVKDLHGTGIAEIDEQHKQLFDRVNGFLDSMDPAPKKEEVESLLLFLENYIKHHFSCEERIMAERRCSACVQNKGAHEQFVHEFARFKRQILASSNPTVHLHEMILYLLNWIRTHIAKVDTCLREPIPQDPGTH